MARQRRTMADDDYTRLLTFRDGLRLFLRWSEDAAKAAGLTGPQHQLLLAIRGHGDAPSIRDVADHLLLRHHSVVELVDRAVTAGLVTRTTDDHDHRVVRLSLTTDGDTKLSSLAAEHFEELSRLRRSFESLWQRLPDPIPAVPHRR
jgi:DNA-binding MarR family transcriptional regulator